MFDPTGPEKAIAPEGTEGREDRRKRRIIQAVLIAMVIGFATGVGEQLADLLAKALGA